MHPIMWILILVPPVLAFVLWQGVGLGSRTGNIVPWQQVRLGKYGYWIILTIAYIATFAAALGLHQL
jgi:hypothetical protein